VKPPHARILITGGASGLGRATAARFLTRGDRVLVTDVDGDAAAATARALGATGSLALDVRHDEDWAAARTWVEERWGGLDVLVNNAGVAGGGRFDHTPLEDWDWLLAINLLGVVRGCHTFVPLFKRQGHGHLVNVASLAGLLNPPVRASYNVSKAGVVALSETLRAELTPYGIGTTCVCPGFFPTNLAASLRTPDAAIQGLVTKLMGSSPITAEDVARRVVDAVERDRFLVLTEPTGRIAHLVKRTVPPLFRRQVDRAAARLRTRLESGAPAAADGTDAAAASAGAAEAS